MNCQAVSEEKLYKIKFTDKENVNMKPIEIMKRRAGYASGYENIPGEAQKHAKQLCWEYNRTAPNEQDKRRSILQELLGTCSPILDFKSLYSLLSDEYKIAVVEKFGYGFRVMLWMKTGISIQY